MQVIAGALQTEFEKTGSVPEKVFNYKGVDKSSYAGVYGRITRRADKVTSGNVTLQIINTDQTWNDVLANPQNHISPGVTASDIQVGYTGIGFITLFTGKLDSAGFPDVDKVGLSLRDRISYFTQAKIGSSESPADYYSASSYTVFTDDDWSAGRNPSHLVWHILTVWGGLDTTEGAGNTDIDWTFFTAYRDILDSIGIKIQANFTGQTISSALKEIADLTLSTFFSEADGKIVCRYWLGQDNTDVQTYTSAKWTYVPKPDMDRFDIVNKYIVYYGYNVGADTWAGSITEQDATSISNYGTLDKTFDSTTIWNYDSPSATNLGERKLLDTKDPIKYVAFESYPLAYRQQLWDALKLTESFYSWTNQGFRIEELSFDIENSRVGIKGRLTTLYPFLILDHATFGKIDSTNVLA